MHLHEAEELGLRVIFEGLSFYHGMVCIEYIHLMYACMAGGA